MKKLMKMTLATEKTFKDGCEEYLLDCKAKNLRDRTLKHYTDVMKQLYKYIPEDTPIEDLNVTTFREFIVEMWEHIATDIYLLKSGFYEWKDESCESKQSIFCRLCSTWNRERVDV